MFPFLAAGIVALASCNTPQKEVVKIAAINPANMDTTVAAGTDFYEYACGGWIKNNPLKPEYARFGTFDQLRTSQVHLWVASTFGATNMQMLFKVAIPTALPMIFTGLRLALGSSWVALVAAELLAATRGLGYMIQVARMLGRPDVIIVGMITIGVVGYLLSTILEWLQTKFVKGGKK